MASRGLICSNRAPDSTDCKKTGNYNCKNCQLVTVCSTRHPWQTSPCCFRTNTNSIHHFSTVISRARKHTGPYTRSRASHPWAKIHGNRLGFLKAEPQHLWVRDLEPCSATRNISGAMSLPLICYGWMQTKEMNTKATYVFCVLVWLSVTFAW